MKSDKGTPTHVAVVGPFPPLKGGISQHTAQLADALEKRQRVSRFSWSAQYPSALYGREQHDLEAASTPGVEHALQWWNPMSWRRVGKRVADARFVVLPWVSPVHAVPYLVMMIVGRSSRFIIHVHNATPHESMPFAALLLRLTLRRSVGVVCHGESIAKEIRSLDDTIPIRVTPHPPDLEIAVTPLPPVGPIRLLFAGTIREYKGLDLLFDALELLGRDDLDLTVAGEVWSEDVRPTAQDVERVPGRVHLELGYVGDDRLCELIGESHALIAPYRSATQSGIVSLAIAGGRPCVVTPVGSLEEIVADGKNGIVAAEPNSAPALAAAIERLVTDIGGLAAGTASTQWSWDVYADDVLGLVAEGAATGRRDLLAA